MSDSNQENEIVNITNICSTLPESPESEVQRDNMVSTLEGLLKSSLEIIVVEGEEGVGKTTLLAQFARAHGNQTISAFVTNSSRYAWDPAMIAANLHEQIQFALGLAPRERSAVTDAQSMLRGSITALQKHANWNKVKFYFVIDGLEDIPKEEHAAMEQIIGLLPTGLPQFRFLLSGSIELFNKYKLGKVVLKSWALPPFSLDETIKYFRNIQIERSNYETIYKASAKGIPGRLASIRRLCLSGAKAPDEVISNLSEHAPDLLEREWLSAGSIPDSMQLALAAICFDTRAHTVGTLAELCSIRPDELNDFLSKCSFIQPLSDLDKPISFTSYFKRYATRKLSHLKREVFQVGIALLMAKPDSTEAITHLPQYLYESENYSQLLEYLSAEHIGKLIDCTQSWIPLHQKVDLGIATAKTLKRGGDLMRFGVQRAAVTNLESCEERRSEIQAYIALNDYDAALAVAQTAVAKEDRLHILAIIASARKRKNIPIEAELQEQVRQLYEQIDTQRLGVRGVEIARDLVHCQPELAINLIRNSQEQGNSQEQIDLDLARLSLKTFAERSAEKDAREACELLRAQVKHPGIQQFMDTLSLIWGNMSAQQVIAAIQQWEKAEAQIYVMRVWATANRQKEDAALLVEHALNVIVKATEFSPNASVYRELAAPMPYILSREVSKALVDRFDGVRALIQAVGPTEEFVWLQVLLAGAECEYDQKAAVNRFTDIYLSSCEIKDLATKAACLARLGSMLQRVVSKYKTGEFEELHRTATADLDTTLRAILDDTADHYEAVKAPLQTLTHSAPRNALDLANHLNTEPRRDRAKIKIIKSVVSRDPNRANPDFIMEVLGSIHYKTNYCKAACDLSRGLRLRSKDIAHLVPALKTLVSPSLKWICPESRCDMLIDLHEIFIAHPTTTDGAFLSNLRKELWFSWGNIENNCTRIQTGFRIVAEMGGSATPFCKELLVEVKRLRAETILENQRALNTYFMCCRLAIRAFTGLIKQKLFGPNEIEQIADLIDRIPSPVLRVVAWTDVALRLDLEGAEAEGKDVTLKYIKQTLSKIPKGAREQYAAGLIFAAPALFKAHSGTAEEFIDQLESHERDEAYRAITDYLITRELPFEPYDGNVANKPFLRIEVVWDICRLLKKVEGDNALYKAIEKLIENIQVKVNINCYSREQKGDIATKLKSLLTQLPSARYIRHEGYRILAEAQIARFEKATPGKWDDLIERAKRIPNHSDQAFVLTIVADIMPGKSNLAKKKADQFKAAKAKIEGLCSVLDKIDRFEILANHSQKYDLSVSRTAITTALQGALSVNTGDVLEIRKRLIDTAYRLDPSFASKLASGFDDDPARIQKREEIRERLRTLEMRDSLQAGKGDTLTGKKRNPEKASEAAWMALRNLNSGKSFLIQSERTAPYIEEASQFQLDNAYPMLAMVIESEVRSFKDSDNASQHIKPIFLACLTAAELSYRICTKMQNVESDRLVKISKSGDQGGSLILGGERDKAFAIIQKWLIDKADKYIQICDPYFGLEDLALIQLIRSVKRDIPIVVLSSRKHQKDREVQQPWQETYHAHWRLQISETDPGEVRMVIMGTRESGALPIHDRWMLSATSGLRLGSSINSLGYQRACEISTIGNDDLVKIQDLMGTYLNGPVTLDSGEKLFPLSFYLSGD